MADEVVVAETPAAPAPVAPAASAPSWRDSLPEDIRSAPELAKYNDVAALAKGHVNQAKLVGQKAEMRVPGPDATPEEKAAFAKALGVPASPAEYKVKPHELMAHPEWSQEALGDFLKVAHAQGMTPQQVDAAVQFYANFVGAQVKDNAKMEAEAKAALRQEWGVNFETYLGAAQRGVSHMEEILGLEPGALVEATKGSDPAAIAKMFHAIEVQLMEHGYVAGEPIRGVSQADAMSKMQELQAQLMKVPEGSEQAKAIIDQIAAYGRALNRAA